MTSEVIDLEAAQPIVLKPLPDDARSAKRAAMFLALVTDMTVETRDDYDQAVDELRNVKEAWNTMEAERTSWTAPLNTYLDRLNAKFQPYLKTLKSAETIIKDKIAGFLTKEGAHTTELRIAAQTVATATRQDLEAQAEALRAKADTTKNAAARDDLLNQAAALEQTAMVVIAQPVPVAIQAANGITPSKGVGFELVSMLELITHIVNKRPDLVVLLKLDDVKVRAMVKMLGLATDLPGIRVTARTNISVR
jgi:septal ring factor EnvC (AmiA/AmiB activator)